MKVSQSLAGGRLGEKQPAATSGAAGQSERAESSRCPAVCQPRCPVEFGSPQLARAGVCVHSAEGGGEGGGGSGKWTKKRRTRELLFFIFECQWWFLTALNTHVYRLGDQGYEIWHKNSRGRGVKYSAVPVSPPLRASAVWCPLRPSSLLLRPNGSYRHGTDTRCSPSKMSLMVYHSE